MLRQATQGQRVPAWMGWACLLRVRPAAAIQQATIGGEDEGEIMGAALDDLGCRLSLCFGRQLAPCTQTVGGRRFTLHIPSVQQTIIGD